MPYIFSHLSRQKFPFSYYRRYSRIVKMSLKVRFHLSRLLGYFHTKLHHLEQAISAKDAAALDRDLMDVGGFSLDQLMELAGLSVSQAGI
jgi:hypothetical protein